MINPTFYYPDQCTRIDNIRRTGGSSHTVPSNEPSSPKLLEVIFFCTNASIIEPCETGQDIFTLTGGVYALFQASEMSHDTKLLSAPIAGLKKSYRKCGSHTAVPLNSWSVPLPGAPRMAGPGLVSLARHRRLLSMPLPTPAQKPPGFCRALPCPLVAGRMRRRYSKPAP